MHSFWTFDFNRMLIGIAPSVIGVALFFLGYWIRAMYMQHKTRRSAKRWIPYSNEEARDIINGITCALDKAWDDLPHRSIADDMKALKMSLDKIEKKLLAEAIPMPETQVRLLPIENGTCGVEIAYQFLPAVDSAEALKHRQQFMATTMLYRNRV